LAIVWMYRDDYARAGFLMLLVIELDGRSTGCLSCPTLMSGQHDNRTFRRRRRPAGRPAM